MRTSRKNFSKTVKLEVLVECRRKCALCFWLRNDARDKKGQLAHIDRNKLNNTKRNAAWLCLEHHDEYDSKLSQSKGISPDELRRYQRDLHEYLASGAPWPDASALPISASEGRPERVVSLEIYDRRVPVYKRTIQFVQTVLKDLRPDLKDILSFASDTDEALFLFDESLSEYLAEIFKKALRLRAISLSTSRAPADERTAALMDEEIELATWFSEQTKEIRARFVPFLRLL